MNLEAIKPVVDAVLYEGYILYPYRSSATKNRQRWTFGGVYPEAYRQATGDADPSHMQAQCLVAGDRDTTLEVRVGFLQPLSRQVRAFPEPLAAWPAEAAPSGEPVDALEVEGTRYHSWQEALERDIPAARAMRPAEQPSISRTDFHFEAWREVEPIRDRAGRVHGVLERSHPRLAGHVELSAQRVTDRVWRVGIRVCNDTDMDPALAAHRDQASLYSLASTHILLGAAGGRFVSMMDPPPDLRGAAADCDNQGAWPVLVGEPDAQDRMLASPIILYDYPEVAAESPGDTFDATEIDELLSLNILAMTDDEKREMVASDPRAAQLLERTQGLEGEDFMRMHGVLRQPRPIDTTPASSGHRDAGQAAANPLEPEPDPQGPRLAYYSNGNAQLKVGDRVRLNPRAGGDVMDLVLAGKTAVIESIERDFEDRVHVAVALDDDPGRQWGLERMPGHRFFFSPQELQSLETAPDAEAAP